MTGSIRRRVVYAVRWSIAHGLYLTGILYLWKRIALRGKALVLTYHRVLSDEECARTASHPAIVVSSETFDRQMRTLRAGFRSLSETEFLNKLESGQGFEPGSCLVTFDDGWLDTYTRAWPILQRHGIPAVVFLPVRFIDSNHLFWQERLSQVLLAIWTGTREGNAFRTRAQAVLQPHGLERIIDAPSEMVHHDICEAIRATKMNSGDQEHLADALAEQLGLAPTPGETFDRFMSWDAVRSMAACGIRFGAHGSTHRMLSALSVDEIRHEVDEAYETLDRELGARAETFCYPSGDWNAAVVSAVSARGFRAAFSTKQGPITPLAERFTLRRVNIHEDMTRNTPMFLSRILGLF